MEMRGRSRREMSPEREERGRGVIQARPRGNIKPPPTFKKVQVVYYLSKCNGQLEHPHFIEVTHLAHQHLRLKDVMDRLTVLRGRAMPSLYSWSYKRSYRNGYVWNDLAENDDIISPTEGAEYVLKGSELIETFTEKFQPPQQRHKFVIPKRSAEPEEFENTRYEDEDDGNQEEEYFEEKTGYTLPNTPLSRCSIGVSTDEIEQAVNYKTTHKTSSTELTHENLSPPSATSSTVSEKAVNETSKRFEDGDPGGTESGLSRNSVLYNLIACGGGSVSFRGKTKVPVRKEPEEVEAPSPAQAGRKSSSNLHKGVLCKTAVAAMAMDEEEIRCMSENPRFGNLQAEEKEYFSGSIVEAMSEDERTKMEPVLKKSNSYNEERVCRGSKTGFDMVGEKTEGKRREKEKGKCIPRSKKTSSSCLSSLTLI